jgi:hypothetical protein
VTCVRFSYNRRHAISLGGEDSTILLWAHSLEQAESDGDDNDSISSAASYEGDDGFSKIDLKNEIGDIGTYIYFICNIRMFMHMYVWLYVYI